MSRGHVRLCQGPLSTSPCVRDSHTRFSHLSPLIAALACCCLHEVGIAHEVGICGCPCDIRLAQPQQVRSRGGARCTAYCCCDDGDRHIWR